MVSKTQHNSDPYYWIKKVKDFLKLSISGSHNIDLILLIHILERGIAMDNGAHAGSGKPGKSWNFIVVFSRTGKSRKVAEKLLNSSKRIRNVWQTVKRRVKGLVWIVESWKDQSQSWKFVSEKGYKPWLREQHFCVLCHMQNQNHKGVKWPWVVSGVGKCLVPGH